MIINHLYNPVLNYNHALNFIFFRGMVQSIHKIFPIHRLTLLKPQLSYHLFQVHFFDYHFYHSKVFNDPCLI